MHVYLCIVFVVNVCQFGRGDVGGNSAKERWKTNKLSNRE